MINEGTIGEGTLKSEFPQIDIDGILED